MAEYDVVVIGSGPGGYVAAIAAAKLGLKTACVEKHTAVGGTCLNVGCIPSKTLLQSTEMYATLLHDGKELGIISEDLKADFPQMMKRKTQVIEGLVSGINSMFKGSHVDRILGNASFVDPNTIEVVNANEKQTIRAKNFILATGSESTPLPFLPVDEKVIITSTGALSLPTIPKKMIVIGAGFIGVELASVYNRLGTEVIIVEMLDKIGAGLDDAISKSLLKSLKNQGLTFHLGAQVKSGKVEKNQAILEVALADGKIETMQADVVLVAVGRRPFTKGLNLEKIGLEFGKGFMPVNDRFQTKLPHIYAIGDLIDGPMLAHKASEEGMAVAKIIAGKNPKINYLAIPNVIYTHPEAASVGLTEAEAKALNLQLLIGTSFFKANARARCIGFTEGLVKIIGDAKTGRLLGLHILGPNASEMIGEGVIALQKKATLQDIAATSHAHPTLSESILEAAQNALHN